MVRDHQLCSPVQPRLAQPQNKQNNLRVLLRTATQVYTWMAPDYDEGVQPLEKALQHFRPAPGFTKGVTIRHSKAPCTHIVYT